MEGQENTFVVKPQTPLSIIGVLREAFKTTRRNGKLVATILLLVFLSSSQLELGTKLALAPILQELGSHWQSTASFGSKTAAPFRDAPTSQWTNQNKYTHNGEIAHTGSIQRANMGSFDYMGKPVSTGELKGLRAFLGVELSILAVSCVISLFFLVAAISSSYEAHTAKVMSLKDVFMKFRESWKRPIHTGFCLALISLGLVTLFLIFVGLIPIVAAGSSTYILYAILLITSFVFYVHMAVRWMLSLVVSVLESDSSGLKAIDRAGELMKGKRIQASVLMLLFHFAFGGVHMISSAMTQNLHGWTKMAITIPFTIGLSCVLKLFMFVVYTVYYHERKMSGKEEGVKGQLGRYVPIASAEA